MFVAEKLSQRQTVFHWHHACDGWRASSFRFPRQSDTSASGMLAESTGINSILHLSHTDFFRCINLFAAFKNDPEEGNFCLE